MNIHIIRAKLRKLIMYGHTYSARQLALHGAPPVCPEPLSPAPYRYTDRDAQAVSDIVRSQAIHHDQGQEILSLEREFAGYTGATYALSTNSGTSALQLACKAAGVRPGDEVIVPAYTFVASAQAVLSAGAVPVFADIDDTYTVSPASIQKLLSKRTRAIMVVHMFGNVCRMDAIMAIAHRHRLRVIEDCAQAIGARFAGRDVGSIGDIGCFSFNSKKAVPTGQGGMLITSDKVLYRRAAASRNTGVEQEGKKTDVVSTGGTYFMTEMEAALARSVMRQLTMLNASRKKNYEYLMILMDPLLPYCRSYSVTPRAEPSFSRLAFTVQFKKLGISREWFIRAMNAEGVPVKTLYPTPLYRYSLFRHRKDILTGIGYPFTKNPYVQYASVRLPFVEDFCRNQVIMEFSPYWSFRDIRHIAESFRKILQYKDNRRRI